MSPADQTVGGLVAADVLVTPPASGIKLGLGSTRAQRDRVERLLARNMGV